MIVIMLIISVRLRIGFILNINGNSKDRFVMFFKSGNMLIVNFIIMFIIR